MKNERSWGNKNKYSNLFPDVDVVVSLCLEALLPFLEYSNSDKRRK